ncbi:MAG TPA: hypothetical protein PK789_10780 [Thermomonas sp.]|uniref:hypothetical protein n=1 Tax=Thermomonas sp. TaxID=1971895 RepID=UPI002B9B65FE|nr:hypothetical protein [Thermomonas sp.]HOV97228.1 hypothetical protein [Thermomonas sp.]
MKATVVGLVTPHVLQIIDLARNAEAGINVDWHLRATVVKTVSELGDQYNAHELLGAYIHGLEVAAKDVGQARKIYANVLQTAATLAAATLR